MIKTYIIEDEIPALEAIQQILSASCPSIYLLGSSGNVTDAVEDLKKYTPDLVLADINITGGTSFEVLEKLTVITFKLIFITAYEEFALKAIKFSAIDYLVKPLDPIELINAIEKATMRIEKENTHLMLQTLFANLRTPEKKFEQIILKTAESIYLVNTSEITHLDADGAYTIFFFNDGRKIMVSKVIKEYEALLCDCGFIRVHQSHIVNLSFVDRFEKNDGGYLVLRDSTIVPVSFRKKENLLSILEKIGKTSV